MTKKIKVHMAEMIPVILIAEHPENSNKQSKDVYTALKASILESGFDEPCIVTERHDKAGHYWVVSGNHRFRAAKDLGMEQVPCIVRNDWDEIEQQMQLVKRNYLKGSIDLILFTEQVNKLSREANLAMDVIQERMGFTDAESFAEFYQQEKKREKRVANAVAAQALPQIKMLDDLGTVLSMLFEKHGHTVQQGFIIFPFGGKNHMFVQCTPALKKTLEIVAAKCVADGIDASLALGGLLQIGIHHSKFATDHKHEEIRKEGGIDGDANLKLIEEKKNE